MNNIRSNKGIGLIEVVIGAALVFIIFSGIISVFNFYLKDSVSVTDNIKAEFLAVEGLEALRSIRDNGFSGIASLPRDTDIYLAFDGVRWFATTTPEIIDSVYARSFQISDVYRDSFGAIVSSGTLDSDIILGVVRVSWSDKGSVSERYLSTYLTNALEI